MDKRTAQRCCDIEALENRCLLSGTSLDFTGGAGGIAGTGFTGALPTRYGSGLIASRLALSGGKLLISSTPGDMFAAHNNQANALDINANTTANFVTQTRITGFPFTKNWQYGGLFVGTNQDNHVKIQVGYIGAPAIQFTSEIGGSFSSAAYKNINFSRLSTLDLRLIGNAAAKTITAQYRINSSSDSNWITAGTVTNPSVFSTAGKAGILTTNVGSTVPVTVPFDSFGFQGTAVATTPQPGSGTVAPFSVGRNVNVTRMSGNQLEQQIAINPANPNNVAVATCDGAAPDVIVARSMDGGATWSTTRINGGMDGNPWNTPRPDATATFDAFGNLYVSYLVAKSTSEIRVQVMRSSDGGATFTPVVAVGGAGSDVDAEKIATGPEAGNPGAQGVWVTYTDWRDGRVKVVHATSTGRGQLSPFSAPIPVSTGGGYYPNVAVGPRGQVVVDWQSNSGGQGPSSLMVSSSLNGAPGTFSSPRVATGTNVGGWDLIPSQPDRSIYAGGAMEFDRSGGPTSGRLYMVYTDEFPNESNNTDVMLRWSDNLGATWSNPVRVNDDATTRSQFLPALAVDQTNGKVGVTWHDARNSGGNNTAQYYGAVSTNHGGSFQPNFRISAGMSNQAGANSAPGGEADFGDYSSVAFRGGKLIPAWADNSNSTGDNPNGAQSLMDVYTAVVNVA